MTPNIELLKNKYSALNVTPVWLLIYWRLVNRSADKNYAKAYQLLPNYLPKGVSMPTIEELAVSLVINKLV